MAKMKINGIEDYLAFIESLIGSTDDILKEALYDGAGYVADEFKNTIAAMPVVDETYNLAVYQRSKKTGRAKYKLSVKQREGLYNNLGISKFKKDDSDKITTHVGWDGYNGVKTKKYPNGQPVRMIARVVESGSSYFDKRPFINKTIKRARKKAEEQMKEKIEKRIEEMKKE